MCVERKGWFDCLAYLISFTLLLCFSASASAVAPGSPMSLFQRLHDRRWHRRGGVYRGKKKKGARDSVRPRERMRPRHVLQAGVARAGLQNRFQCVGSQPTDGIAQVPCFFCHCLHFDDFKKKKLVLPSYCGCLLQALVSTASSAMHNLTCQVG